MVKQKANAHEIMLSPVSVKMSKKAVSMTARDRVSQAFRSTQQTSVFFPGLTGTRAQSIDSKNVTLTSGFNVTNTGKFGTNAFGQTAGSLFSTALKRKVTSWDRNVDPAQTQRIGMA